MTLNNKNGLFRPWDELRSGIDDISGVEEERVVVSKLNYIGEVNVKCERSEEEDAASGQSLSPSPSASASGSSNLNDAEEEEEDSLHKLTSLVDRTILGLPTSDNSVDSSSSSCSETSFSTSSPAEEPERSPERSAFVPARLTSHPSAFTFPGVSYPVGGVQQRFDAAAAAAAGGLLRQEIIARQEHAAFDQFAAQQNHFALEEAARLLQHHEALVKQNKKLRPKKFRCPHCDVAFSNNGQLKGHIRIHTGSLKPLIYI